MCIIQKSVSYLHIFLNISRYDKLIFSFNAIKCTRKMQLSILKDRREEEIDRAKGWGRRCLCVRVLKVWRL